MKAADRRIGLIAGLSVLVFSGCAVAAVFLGTPTMAPAAQPAPPSAAAPRATPLSVPVLSPTPPPGSETPSQTTPAVPALVPGDQTPHQFLGEVVISAIDDTLTLQEHVDGDNGPTAYHVLPSGQLSTTWSGSSTESSRTNVLILGIDRRSEQGDAVRSDTMILGTISTSAPQIALLSIPRDLYVDIPGYGRGRINTAHFWGENECEGGGPALAEQTILENFGVRVDHYVRVDFEGFRAIIDAVGGIDINVDEPIVDNAYPTEDYDTIRIDISAGRQHMDGETALRYARSRHGSSDFDRAERQQQVIVALARRLTLPGAWRTWPLVVKSVMANVDTDLGVQDLRLLVPTLLQVGPEGIERRVIDSEMTRPWTTPTGGAVLLPRWERITPVVQEVFAPQGINPGVR